VEREELRDEGTELLFRVCDVDRKAVDIVLDSDHVMLVLHRLAIQLKLQFKSLRIARRAPARIFLLPVYNSCCEAVDSCLAGGVRPGGPAFRRPRKAGLKHFTLFSSSFWYQNLFWNSVTFFGIPFSACGFTAMQSFRDSFHFLPRVQEDELRVVVRARENTPDSPLCNSDVARP